jgi:hypothetical protein
VPFNREWKHPHIYYTKSNKHINALLLFKV